jgi:5-enolpyruvylshikimate-3-phosphate synthase
MANVLVQQGELFGEVNPLGYVELGSRLIFSLSFINGGVISNLPTCGELEKFINILNSAGADIVYENNTADIFPFNNISKNIDLKNSQLATKLFLPHLLFLENQLNVLNPFFNKEIYKNFLTISNNLNSFFLKKEKNLYQVGGGVNFNQIAFDSIGGSFWGSGFIIAAFLANADFYFKFDDFSFSHPTLYHSLACLDILNIPYLFEKEEKLISLGSSNAFLEEVNIDLPPSPILASYYLAALLLSGKGKVFFPTNLNHPLVSFFDKIDCSTLKKFDGYYTIEKSEYSFSEPIDPKIYPSAVPLFILLATQSKTKTKIGPFVPFKNKILQKIFSFTKKLSELGAKIDYVEPYFEVTPSKLYGGIVEASDAHEAMSFILAGLISRSPLKVKGVEKILQVNKNFFDDLKNLNLTLI